MRIPNTLSRLGAPEVRAVVRALRNGCIGGNGVISRRVQAELALKTGARHALLVPSATAALELYLRAADVGPGDEVLMPSLAHAGRAEALRARGAVPVFCELDPATLNLDPADAERRITARTKAILPVHHAGIACDMDALDALARRRGLRVIEDAAAAIGATWRGRRLGTLGHAGLLSFDATRNVVCGAGGALLTDDDELFRRAESAQVAGSLVLSDLLAALLEAQLGRLERITADRRRVWAAYHAGLAELEAEGRLTRPTVPANAEHNGHAYVLRAPDPTASTRWIEGLGKRGIQATGHLQRLHAAPLALAAARTLVRLPLHDGLRRRHVERVLRAVAEVVRASPSAQ
jgi:dTDP-4-amino-4,6-dideoxygalactose transaminase